MPRPPRTAILGDAPVTIHFIWRCHNHSFLLEDDDDRQHYLDLLVRAKAHHGIAIYGYAIMSNHFHAVLRIPSRGQWQRFSRTVNSQLATRINRRRGRCGQVVMDRPRTIVLERDEDVLATLRYIDHNPVRAGLVQRPREYRWSSYRHHALGEANAVVDECPAVQGLARTLRQCRVAYQALAAAKLADRYRHRRTDLVDVHFVGSARWCEARRHELRKTIKTRAGPHKPTTWAR